ncbi:MAG: ABC transporter transmembrane domain-containing protein [Thalassobaculaceae bacterium]|nr:ABC transporter transmembrane domain-containing protein [Thalassobaculaceae bacterium]
MTLEATSPDTGEVIPPSVAQHLLDGVELPTDTLEDRIAELLSGPLRWRAEMSDLASCLPALLAALGWNGIPRQLVDALPSDESSFDLTDMTNTLIRLGFVAQRRRVNYRDIASAGPAIWLRRGKPAVVVLDYSDLGALIYDPSEGKQRSIKLPRGKADVLLFIDVRADSMSGESAPGAATSWFRGIFDAFRGLVAGGLALSFVVNVLALAMPLFVMAVYDRIIATGDRSGIWWLMGGVGIAIVCDLVLRHLRMRMQIFVGARLNYLVGSRIVEHMMSLPLALLKRAGVTAQVARIRDLERIRSVIAGPLATSMLEFPVLLVFVVAIAVVGGWMAVVPAAAAVF